jgi:2-C-methyl-D-erythritol 4-phosphate cytidylyltransferase
LNFIKYAKKIYMKPLSEEPFVSAVIVAAGKSERMGKCKSKQFVPLCGIAAIARTLSAFEESQHVREVILVTKKFDIGIVGSIVREFGFSKVSRIVVGGETRQQSAAIGMNAVSKAAQFIAVHDGARPLVTADCIDRVIGIAFKCGAASAAVRVKDTLKVADENGVVVSTPDRQRLWAVQTPQVFDMRLYREALEAAVQSGADYTDDCQLIEAAGGHVQLVEGEYTNIKITTVEDIPQAEAIIRARGDAF